MNLTNSPYAKISFDYGFVGTVQKVFVRSPKDASHFGDGSHVL